MGTKIKQTFVMTWPVGEYVGRIDKIVEKPGDYGPQLQFSFKLIQMDEKASPVLGWCSQTFSNKSKLYGWVKAAFGGGEIPKTYNFDSDDLIGKKVLLTLVIRTRDDGTELNRIDSLRAIPETGEIPNLPAGTEAEPQLTM